MNRILMTLTGAALLVSIGSPALAGSPGSSNRKATMPLACAGGPDRGSVCESDAQCAPSTCEVDVRGTAARPYLMTVTLIIDDDVSQFDGSESIANVVAATVLLEVKDRGRTHLLAQTFQNLSGATLEELVDNLRAGPVLADQNGSNQRATEAGLVDAVRSGGILDDMLFEEGDAPLADRLREALGQTGRPVIVRSSTPSRVQLDDGGADGTASVLRMSVLVRFLAP